MSDEDINENWTAPPRPMRPLPQVARLTEERDKLRALLVKACVEIAQRAGHGLELSRIEARYGIRLRWNGETFEEDTTK